MAIIRNIYGDDFMDIFQKIYTDIKKMDLFEQEESEENNQKEREVV